MSLQKTHVSGTEDLTIQILLADLDQELSAVKSSHPAAKRMGERCPLLLMLLCSCWQKLPTSPAPGSVLRHAAVGRMPGLGTGCLQVMLLKSQAPPAQTKSGGKPAHPLADCHFQ